MNPSNPPPDPGNQSDCVNSFLVVIDGPWDQTRRPRRPGIPYTPPVPPGVFEKEPPPGDELVVIDGPWAEPRIYPDMAGMLDNPDAAYAKLKEMGKGLFGANGGGPVVTANAGSGTVYLYKGSFKSRPRIARQWRPKRPSK